MTVTTTKYIRKPLYVEAVRVTGANFDKIAAWCQGEVQQDQVPGKGTGKKYIHVRVHNPKNPRQTKAFVGDWILYTERGYKVYTNKAFHDSFDKVEELQEERKTISGNPPTSVAVGDEEIAPGITANEAVEALREEAALEEQRGNGLVTTEPGKVKEERSGTGGSQGIEEKAA